MFSSLSDVMDLVDVREIMGLADIGLTTLDRGLEENDGPLKGTADGF